MLAMTLRYVESSDVFSTYQNRDGEEVYFAHGWPLRRVYELTLEFARLIYSTHTDSVGNAFHNGTRYLFLNLLRTVVTDPDAVDEIQWCADCDLMVLQEDLNTVNDGDGSVCDRCLDYNYRTCDRCNDSYHCDYTVTLLDGCTYCEGCRDNGATWCEACDGYYHDSDSGEHQHDGSGCCDAPQQNFSVRNDGKPMLANDTRATITLPGGIIDPQGLQRISRLLYDGGHRAAYFELANIGNTWMAKTGSFPKRLSRATYKRDGSKLPQDIMSEVGNIAAEHSRPVDFDIELTRDLNKSAEEFYHEDSCWWQSYHESRCALKSNGGYGMRSFDPDSNCVSGRAWVMPLKIDASRHDAYSNPGALTPTFNTETPDAFVVFNGYGDLDGYIPARIVAHMAGLTYRKIQFTCSPMFVNGDSGYLVAPEDVAVQYEKDGRFHLSLDSHSSLHAREVNELIHTMQSEALHAAAMAADIEREMANV